MHAFEKELNRKTVLVAVTSAFVVACIFVYGTNTVNSRKEAEARKQAEQEIALKLAAQKQRVDHFKDIALEARAAYVYDVNKKKVLFEKNADVPLPLASITKVMTALVAKENLDADKKITIDASSLDEEGDSGLFAGERWSLKNLLSYTLVVSSNDGARSLASVFNGISGGATSAATSTDAGTDKHPNFIDEMNGKAAEIGLSSMSFSNPTGLDLESIGEAGGYGSAKDVASLFEYALRNHPDLLEPTRYLSKGISSDTMLHQAENTNISTNKVPNLIASKTGYTTMAGGNLAIAFDKGLNEPVIVVVLGSSIDGRFRDVVRLASSTMETYNR